jgi:hypothetical protein
MVLVEQKDFEVVAQGISFCVALLGDVHSNINVPSISSLVYECSGKRRTKAIFYLLVILR